MLSIMNFYTGMKLFVSVQTGLSSFATTLIVADLIAHSDSSLSIFGENGEEVFISNTSIEALTADEDGIEINYDNGSVIYLANV